ncbi:MAG: hypothetical protein KKB51_24485 [Candidatus Riflebacteria bacterium]|nr:hypothetical protein [Candidatus Riflebacteria bacterium]
MEILLFLLEIILSLAFEGAAEISGHKIKKARQKKYDAKVACARISGTPDPEALEPFSWVGSVIYYAGLGMIFGVTSLFLFPNSFIKSANGRLVYLFLTPVIAGMAMSLIGRVRDKNGEEPIRLDNFFYGFLFALSMALLRYYMAV